MHARFKDVSGYLFVPLAALTVAFDTLGYIPVLGNPFALVAVKLSGVTSKLYMQLTKQET